MATGVLFSAMFSILIGMETNTIKIGSKNISNERVNSGVTSHRYIYVKWSGDLMFVCSVCVSCCCCIVVLRPR